MEDKRQVTLPKKDIITPDDIQAVLNSDRMAESNNLLKDAQNTTKNQSNHTKVRNNILMQIVVRNCGRTGTLMNMRVQEFMDAELKRLNEVDTYVISVAEHKTVRTYQAANCVISSEVHSYISTYLSDFRPPTTSPYIFVTWSGLKMDAGSISNALTVELGHAGVERHVTCTGLRHMASTLVSSILPDADQKDLANFMAHSSHVQQKYYNQSLKTSSNVRMSTLLYKMVHHGTVGETDLASAVIG